MDVGNTLDQQYAIEDSLNHEFFTKNEKLPNLNTKDNEEFRMHLYFKQISPKHKKKMTSPYESYNISSVLKSISNQYNTYKRVIQQVHRHTKVVSNSQKLKFDLVKYQEDSQNFRHESLESSQTNLQQNNISKIKEYLKIYNISSKLTNSKVNLGINKSYHVQNIRTNSSIDRKSQLFNNQTNASIASQEADQSYLENEYFQQRQNFNIQTENDDEIKTINQNEQQQERSKIQVSTENYQKRNKSEIYQKLRSFSSINSKNPSEFQDENLFKKNRRDIQNRNTEDNKKIQKIKIINRDDIIIKRERNSLKDQRNTNYNEDKIYDCQDSKQASRNSNYEIHLPIIEHNSRNEEIPEENLKQINKTKKKDTQIINLNMNKRNSFVKTQETPRDKYNEYIRDYNIECSQQASKTALHLNDMKKKSIDKKGLYKKQLKNFENQSITNENSVYLDNQPKKKISQGDIRHYNNDNDILLQSINNSLQKQIKQIEKKNDFMKLNTKEMPQDPNNFLEFKAQKEIEKSKMRINKEQIFLLEKKKEEFQKLIQQQQNLPQNRTDRKNVHSSIQYRPDNRQKNPRQIYSRITDVNYAEQISIKNQSLFPMQQISNINKLLDTLDAKKQKLQGDAVGFQSSSPNKKLFKSEKKQVNNNLDQNQINIQKQTKKAKKNENNTVTLDNQKNQSNSTNPNSETLEKDELKQINNDSINISSKKQQKEIQKQEENYDSLASNINSHQTDQNQENKQTLIKSIDEDPPIKRQKINKRNDSLIQQDTKQIGSIQNDFPNQQQQNQININYVQERPLFTEQYERKALRDKNKNQKSFSLRQSQEENLNQENIKQVRRQQKFQKIMEYDTQKKFTEISRIIDRMTKNREHNFRKSKEKDFKSKQVTFQLTESQLNSD